MPCSTVRIRRSVTAHPTLSWKAIAAKLSTLYMRLQVRVAARDDRRLTLPKGLSAEAQALVVWLDEQVDELVTPDCEVADRRAIDYGYPRLELGFGPEPIKELLPGVCWIRDLNLAGEQF